MDYFLRVEKYAVVVSCWVVGGPSISVCFELIGNQLERAIIQGANDTPFFKKGGVTLAGSSNFLEWDSALANMLSRSLQNNQVGSSAPFEHKVSRTSLDIQPFRAAARGDP